MNLEPLYDRIVVRPIEKEEKTSGGIIVPDIVEEKAMYGIVIAVGEGMPQDDGKIAPLKVKFYDKILYPKKVGTEIKIGNENIIIMNEYEVLAIVK